jgi:hypothetical protein
MNLLYKPHEILGTFLPIYRKKEENHFTYEEIVHLELGMDNFKVAGYTPVRYGNQFFFTPIYALKE